MYMDKQIVYPRDSGRTIAMITQAAISNGIIIARDVNEKERIEKLAASIGLPNVEVRMMKEYEAEMNEVIPIDSGEMVVHVNVNGREAVKRIRADNFDKKRFEKWADSMDDNLFDYELKESRLLMGSTVVANRWSLYMFFSIDAGKKEDTRNED